MDRYLRNYCRINQRHMDISDYENFYTNARAYIARRPEEHEEMARILLQAIGEFGNTALIGISYRLLSELSCKVKIPSKLIKKHFRTREIRDAMYPLVSRCGLTVFDRKLLKLLYDPHYESAAFFQLLRSRREWVASFLEIEDSVLLRKQMMAMVHSRTFHNLGYFIRCFGSSDRSISFLCYEAFTLFIEELDPREDGMVFECASFRILSSEGQVSILLVHRLEVESEVNFLINFIDFLPNRNEVVEGVRSGNKGKVAGALAEYISIGSGFELPHGRWFESKRKRAAADIPPVDEDVDFDYLFDGRCYKDITDCIEI
jgi:hypothetical protein